MAGEKVGKLALLWRGDRQARSEATTHNNRFSGVFQALATRGIEAEPARIPSPPRPAPTSLPDDACAGPGGVAGGLADAGC